jgi:hypothetical protein
MRSPNAKPTRWQSQPPSLRLAVVLGFLLIAGAVLALLAPLADVPSGMVRLELAGTAGRAAQAHHGVSARQVRAALWWDLVVILGYSAVLIGGLLLLFPVRVYRVRGWRAFAWPARVVVALGAGLEVIENLFLFGALDWQRDRDGPRRRLSPDPSSCCWRTSQDMC